MSSTVTYKGNTIALISNTTKTLNTKGKYLEDNITITDVTSSGGTNGVDRISSVISTFASDATASAGDIKSGETSYVNGNKVTRTLAVNKYYVGTSEPVASDYEDGDIYLKVEKVYKKVNGSMVEQDITTAFDSNTNYVRG